MKTIFSLCLAVSMVLCADEEVALILKNEDPPAARPHLKLEDVILESRNLFKAHNSHLSKTIFECKKEILDSLRELKTELGFVSKPTPRSIACESSVERMPNPMVQKPQCEPEKQLPSAYNAPYDLGLECDWHLHANANFLYWMPVQEGMQTYTLYSLDSILTSPGHTNRVEVFEAGAIDFKYKPAFKVGLGGTFSYDNWELYAEYTWFNHSFTDSFNYTDPNSSSTFQSNLFPDFCLKMNNFSYFLLQPSTLFSRFNLNLNWIFLELARSYYVGKKVVFRTHLGLRGDRNTQSISQHFNLSQTTTSFEGNLAPVNGKVKQTTNSWAIGPRAGITANYLIPYGFRVYGDVALSLLYTQFTLKAHQNSSLNYHPGPEIQTQDSTIVSRSFKTASPDVETSIGLGWGKNFARDRSHIDLAVGYDFIAMWNQNLFRQLVVQNVQTASGDGDSARILFRDLFIYGLNVQLAFDF